MKINTTTNLNQNEILVLKAIATASDANGGDFTYFEDVMDEIESFSDNQVKGYISQLSQKGYISNSDDKFCQICAGKFVDYLTEYEF